MLSLSQRLSNSVGLLVALSFRFLVVLHVHGAVSRDWGSIAEIRFCTLHFLDDLAEFLLRVLVDWILVDWVVLFVSCGEEFILFAKGDTTLPESFSQVNSCSLFCCKVFWFCFNSLRSFHSGLTNEDFSVVWDVEILLRRRHLLHFLNRINHPLLTDIFSFSVTSCNHVRLGRFVSKNEVWPSNLAYLLTSQVFWHVLAHNTFWLLGGTGVLSVTLYDVCHLINLIFSVILKYLV